MKNKKKSLLIPVENQVREFDPKLLLAYIAAKRGFSSVIGPRREMHFQIASFPRSIYLSKSITHASANMFGNMRKLGHEIVAWDEEALIHLPPETYFSRRLSPLAMSHVSHFFAWGEDNAELWRQYPELPPGAEIHVSGNPRGDLLRPEMHSFFQQQVTKLRESYGNFILINTNFNHVNGFYPSQNLFLPVSKPGEEPKFGRAALGMSREFAEGLRDHKQAIFEDFKRLIPALEQALPKCTIVVRPHPTEDPEVYHRIAAACERVRVTNEGNVVPWLLATQVLVHNGCTTGVEAYVMKVPAISYRETVNDFYDHGFYRLSNMLSHQCFTFEELRTTVSRILSGELGVKEGDDRKALIDHYMAAIDGPLACERIVDVLESMMEGRSELPKPVVNDRLYGWYKTTWRGLKKRIRSYLPGSHRAPAFLRHRYPSISLEDVRERISRLQEALGESREVEIEQVSRQFFRISG